jgi:UDP-3-O-[3-hydroxymyristoyl] glucosamine N-acyltransferase
VSAKGFLTLEEVASLVGATLSGSHERAIDTVASLEEADESSLAFLGNPRYTAAAQKTRAGALLVTPQAAGELQFPAGCSLLIVDDPSAAFQQVALWFLAALREPSGFEGIHPTAVVHETAVVEEGVTLGPFAVVDARSRIGSGTWVGPHVSIGAGVQIGRDCQLHPHSVVREGSILHDRVILQPGAIVGACGFGYLPSPEGHRKVEHLGRAELQDDVEVGANSCIDKARFRTTSVGEGTKIDNLVQVGHNARIGPHNLIVSQVGIAGSSSTGAYCVIGGQAAIVGHVHLADGVQLAARAAATKNLSTGPYSGAPAVPYQEGMRLIASQRMVPKLAERIRRIEQGLLELSQKPTS